MKKLTSWVLILALAFMLCACGETVKDEEKHLGVMEEFDARLDAAFAAVEDAYASGDEEKILEAEAALEAVQREYEKAAAEIGPTENNPEEKPAENPEEMPAEGPIYIIGDEDDWSDEDDWEDWDEWEDEEETEHPLTLNDWIFEKDGTTYKFSFEFELDYFSLSYFSMNDGKERLGWTVPWAESSGAMYKGCENSDWYIELAVDSADPGSSHVTIPYSKEVWRATLIGSDRKTLELARFEDNGKGQPGKLIEKWHFLPD